VKIYSVGQRSSLLPDRVLEMDFDGDSLSDLLKSVEKDGKTLYGEVVQGDGSYSHGYALALNGEIVRCEELDKKQIPNSSDLVVVHLMQIPAGG
jgi:sulfur carrier protein ThiS